MGGGRAGSGANGSGWRRRGPLRSRGRPRGQSTGQQQQQQRGRRHHGPAGTWGLGRHAGGALLEGSAQVGLAVGVAPRERSAETQGTRPLLP